MLGTSAHPPVGGTRLPSRLHAPHPDPRAGFTLIEVMIAISLISVGLVALGGTLSSTIRLGDQRLSEIRKSVHAQSVITHLQTLELAELLTLHGPGGEGESLWFDSAGSVHTGASTQAVASGTIEVWTVESEVPADFGTGAIGLDLDGSGAIEEGECDAPRVLPVRITIRHPREPGVSDAIVNCLLRP